MLFINPDHLIKIWYQSLTYLSQYFDLKLEIKLLMKYINDLNNILQYY